MLWGRGIRGPVLSQLWRTYCYKSERREGIKFNPDYDCPKCGNFSDCPFANLRGTGDGEYKDKPRVIFTNLKFSEEVSPGVLTITTRTDKFLGVAEGKAPVRVEYIPEGAEFLFEVILQGVGKKYEDEVKRAIRVSLEFFGWGGFCNEGFGRGKILEEERMWFKDFEEKIIMPTVEEMQGLKEITMKIEPILILEENKKVLVNILEEGFLKKLRNSINERYWQFFGDNIYVPITKVGGRARRISIRYWSKKDRREGRFTGLGNELKIYFEKTPEEEHLRAIALCRYGIGRFKNMGFGSLIPVVDIYK